MILTRPYRVELWLPRLPRMNTSDRIHRWLAIKERDAIFAEVSGLLWGKVPSEPLPWSRVVVTRCSGSREPDAENLSQGGKHIFDALVHYRVLADDSPRHVKRVYRWKPAKRGKGGVRVLIAELER